MRTVLLSLLNNPEELSFLKPILLIFGVLQDIVVCLKRVANAVFLCHVTFIKFKLLLISWTQYG